MVRYPARRSGAPLLALAHGAGAGERHPWMCRVAQGLADRGVSVVTFEFPYKRAGRRVPDPVRVLEEAFTVAWEDVAGSGTPGPRKLFAGGKSMGGRIASLVAARQGFVPTPAGLVFFGYPLHPPGRPDRRRDGHLPHIDLPMLFVHGMRDAFGSPQAMQRLEAALPNATLHLIPAADHSLLAPRREDPAGDSLEGALDVAADWIGVQQPARTAMIPR